jgi:hypothetical protein
VFEFFTKACIYANSAPANYVGDSWVKPAIFSVIFLGKTILLLVLGLVLLLVLGLVLRLGFKVVVLFVVFVVLEIRLLVEAVLLEF